MTRGVVAAMLLLILGFSSCRKAKNDRVREYILGKWKATENARDDNGNGKLDAGEAFPDALYAENNLVFESDGTLMLVNSSALKGRKQWELLHGDSYLRVTEPAYATDYHIDEISGSSLVLKDTSNGHTSWFMFAKVQ